MQGVQVAAGGFAGCIGSSGYRSADSSEGESATQRLGMDLSPYGCMYAPHHVQLVMHGEPDLECQLLQ